METVDQGREPFQDFYSRMRPKLVARAYGMCFNRQDAEDVVQESFLAMLPHWARYSGYETPEAIVDRAMRQRVWKLQRQRTFFLKRAKDIPSPLPAPDPQFNAETQERLTVLKSLSKRQRFILVLHDGCGVPAQEIADDLGISPSTVRVHLAKARANFRLLYGQEGWGRDLPGFLSEESGTPVGPPPSDRDAGEEVAAVVRGTWAELYRYFEADRVNSERMLAALEETAARQGWSTEGEA
ncbi:sigma-70 family RNA polymerase sigma factor [Streptomyces sp. NPDC052095]|uniref:RNA polymerase sigma factor n=1 Tax=unclassified Streptomyces TaxID=2593676 RepID=UPI00344CD330